MFRNASRFAQSRASSGRTLSGYPEARKIGKGQQPQQTEFQVGSAYVTKLIPFMRIFFKKRLSDSAIVRELQLRDIGTPSGKSWTVTDVAELIQAVRMTNLKKARAGKAKRLKDRKGMPHSSGALASSLGRVDHVSARGINATARGGVTPRSRGRYPR